MKSDLSYMIFKIMQLDAKNNNKTSLGLISLMINLNHYDNVFEFEK